MTIIREYRIIPFDKENKVSKTGEATGDYFLLELAATKRRVSDRRKQSYFYEYENGGIKTYYHNLTSEEFKIFKEVFNIK